MVARFIPAAHLTIDAGSFEARGNRGAQEDMVDAHAGVASLGIPEVLPEGVDALVRCMARRASVQPYATR